MKPGTLVAFSWQDTRHADAIITHTGRGEVISEPDAKGNVLVACDATPADGRRHVILCATAWLTDLTPPVDPPPAPPV